MSESTTNIAVLVSGGGTTLQNLIDQIRDGKLDARVVTVIASRPGIKGIERARNAGIPVQVVVRKEFASVEAFSDRIFAILADARTDLLCLGGWLQLLKIPDVWIGRTINIHPSLLPLFGGKGMWGHHVHEAVLAAGCKVSGCTVHFVNNEYDAGPIILQRICPVEDGDTADTLAARVFEEEKIAYPQAIRLWQAGRLKIIGRRVVVS